MVRQNLPHLKQRTYAVVFLCVNVFAKVCLVLICLNPAVWLNVVSGDRTYTSFAKVCLP